MWERLTALSWPQVLLAAVLAFFIWGILRFLLSFRQTGGRQTWGEVDMARVMERCREMFPIETILFRGAEFRRGMQVRIMTTQQNIIEGELIGMNKINMVCIRTRTQIIAHHLEKIQEMTRLS